MFRLIVGFTFVIGAYALSQSSIPQQDIDSAVARAEALYFEARFRESIEVILPLDAALRQEPQRIRDRIRVKLQIALAHVGLNETEEAKARFLEMCVLDSGYSLDPGQFASKVMTLFEEAKAESVESRCTTVCQEVDRILDVGTAEAFLKLLEPQEASCPCARAAVLDAAELLHQKGVEAYKEDNFTDALHNLRAALKLNPAHELAAQYVELTQNKLRLAADRLVLEWRLHFEAREFPLAAAKYRDLSAANIEGVAAPALDQIRSEYQKMLTSMAEAWVRACPISEVLAAETRRQAAAMLPDAALGTETLASMNACPVDTCLQVSPQLAMSRLRTRVSPELPRSSLPARPTTVRVKVKIDEKGDVVVNSMEGGGSAVNSAVKLAVEQWKFTPAVVDDRPRCVETELPIALNPF
jgi:tetratricopeptide (TPR) repeat protein